MGTNIPHTCIPGLVWPKRARRFPQFELKVGELGFPIHFVCVSAALYHRGHAAAIFSSKVNRVHWPGTSRISLCLRITLPPLGQLSRNRLSIWTAVFCTCTYCREGRTCEYCQEKNWEMTVLVLPWWDHWLYRVCQLLLICLAESGRVGRGDHEPGADQHFSTSCSLHCLHRWCVDIDHPSGRGRPTCRVLFLVSPSLSSLSRTPSVTISYQPWQVAAASAMTSVLSLPCQPDWTVLAWEIPSLMQTTLSTLGKLSLKVSGPLWALVALQRSPLGDVAPEQHRAKAGVKKAGQSRAIAQQADLLAGLPQASRLSVELASEKGASSWLTTLPVVELGLHLNKSEFCDGLCLRYNWPLRYLPSHCVCGQALMSSMHSPVQWAVYHRNATITFATWRPLCCQKWPARFGVEPRLLQLYGEALPLRSANTGDQARLDIKAYSFWGSHHERALFDVRMFNPFACSYVTSPIGTTYPRHERATVREYEQRVQEIDRASFTPRSSSRQPVAWPRERRCSALSCPIC